MTPALRATGRLIPVLALLAGLSGCGKNRSQRMDELFQAYRGARVPGAAVLLIRDREPAITRTYGMAELERMIPVTGATNFRLASITKQFTAMCIAMLVERGALRYSTTIAEVFEEFPAYGQAITVEQLLNHTSGLWAYEDLLAEFSIAQLRDRDVLDLMRSQDATYFPPGSAYRYSNSGYAVLAMIVEQISGLDFADFLQKNIFVPLEMNTTVAHEASISSIANRAYGYAMENDRPIRADQSATSAVLGDGGIYSSIDDLYKWDRAQYRDDLVSGSTMERMLTPHADNYGHGLRIDDYRGHMRVHHSGSTRGFRAVMQRFPDQRFTVLILTNRSSPSVVPLAEAIVDMYLPGRD